MIRIFRKGRSLKHACKCTTHASLHDKAHLKTCLIGGYDAHNVVFRRECLFFLFFNSLNSLEVFVSVHLELDNRDLSVKDKTIYCCLNVRKSHEKNNWITTSSDNVGTRHT